MKAILVIVALFIKLAILLPLHFIGYVIFPFAYMNRKDNHYPRWAWIWDNDDHGIDGGNFWAKKTKGWPHWLRCMIWTCSRNGLFNFAKYTLGIKGRLYTHEGDHGIGDKRRGGSYWCFALPYFEYYLITPYEIFGLRKCLRVRIGWKMYGKTPDETCQFCFVISPIMTYEGA